MSERAEGTGLKRHSASRNPRGAKEHESTYPSLDRIDGASRTRLGYWMRYLESPGAGAVGAPNFADVLAMESAAMDLIRERFEAFGGWSPWVSKAADRLHESER